MTGHRVPGRRERCRKTSRVVQHQGQPIHFVTTSWRPALGATRSFRIFAASFRPRSPPPLSPPPAPMRRPALRFVRLSANLLAALGLLSCSDLPTAPQMQMGLPLGPQGDVTAVVPALVISQIYGGGGNAGATFKNDFIEIFNPGSAPVNVAGWSVQYASATGTSWAATPLTGTIPAGGYYLVQEALGAGGTTALPTPDAVGTTAMSATAGKVLLASQ